MFGTHDQNVRSTVPVADPCDVDDEAGGDDDEDEQPAASAAAVRPAKAAPKRRYDFMEHSR
jgi:hypothetical protein